MLSSEVTRLRVWTTKRKTPFVETIENCKNKLSFKGYQMLFSLKDLM